MLEPGKLKLRSEIEIIESWKYQGPPYVSVICHAFQQENYVQEAIASFLMQKTDFPFEIIIHDDASTDETRKIIEEYQKKYPNIIFPILQTENQYSQNRKPPSFTFKAARGKYIALCEGDDFWIDENKLNKQVNVFKKYDNISLCFHSAQMHDLLKNTISLTCSHFKHDKRVPLRDVILGRGHYMPTASLMFLNQNIDELIESFRNAPVGDYFIQVYMSALKGTYYINTPMSAYRKNTPQSWSVKKHSGKKAQIKHKMLMPPSIDRFSAYLNMPQYNKLFEEVLAIYFVDTIALVDGFKNKLKVNINLFQLLMELNTLNRAMIIARTIRRLLSKKYERTKRILKKLKIK